MNDLEISKALALAIGWKENCSEPDVQIATFNDPSKPDYVVVWVDDEYRPFDYRDWTVIGPIAERYDCFPFKHYDRGWTTPKMYGNTDTPQKAIALSVIGAKK